MTYRPWPAFGMVDGPMPTPSWVPWGKSRVWGRGGCGGVQLGVAADGGAAGVLSACWSGAAGMVLAVAGQSGVSGWSVGSAG